jgi:hypothetical protein
MLALTSEQQEALASGRPMRRHFVWCEARDPITGDPDPAGLWNDAGDVTHGGRLYHGAGGLVTIGSLSAKGDLSIPGLSVVLSGIDVNVASLVRGRAIAQAPIEVLIGIYDPDTHNIIPPLFTLFTGFVDDCRIVTPAAGGKATIDLTCESTSRALTRSSTATRSQATHQQRDPDDGFFDHVGAQRKQLHFGRAAPGASHSAKSQYLSGGGGGGGGGGSGFAKAGFLP